MVVSRPPPRPPRRVATVRAYTASSGWVVNRYCRPDLPAGHHEVGRLLASCMSGVAPRVLLTACATDLSRAGPGGAVAHRVDHAQQLDGNREDERRVLLSRHFDHGRQHAYLHG